MRRKLGILILILFSMVPAFSQMESGENVVISEKVFHDLYIAGGTVMINAPVHGDLIVAGGKVAVNDTITQDILVIGGEIIINGYVGDDIRGAGGSILLSNENEGDVVMAGGKFKLDKGATIKGNFLGSGGEVVLDGEVKGLIKNYSGTFTLNGKAGNEVEIRGRKISINGTVEGNSVLVASTIELGPEANFFSNVKYWNKEGALDFGNTITGGQAIFDPTFEMESTQWKYLGFASLFLVLWYLGSALLMTFLIQYLFGGTFKGAADTVKNTSLKSLGLGFLYLVGVPVLIVFSMISLVGLPIGIFMLLVYISVLIFATVIVALLTSHWINNNYYKASWGTGKIVFVAFGIFIFLKLASFTPFIGPLIMLLLVCMAIGSLLLTIKWKPRERIVVSGM